MLLAYLVSEILDADSDMPMDGIRVALKCGDRPVLPDHSLESLVAGMLLVLAFAE
jgi:hypothetical protein